MGVERSFFSTKRNLNPKKLTELFQQVARERFLQSIWFDWAYWIRASELIRASDLAHTDESPGMYGLHPGYGGVVRLAGNNRPIWSLHLVSLRRIDTPRASLYFPRWCQDSILLTVALELGLSYRDDTWRGRQARPVTKRMVDRVYSFEEWFMHEQTLDLEGRSHKPSKQDLARQRTLYNSVKKKLPQLYWGLEGSQASLTPHLSEAEEDLLAHTIGWDKIKSPRSAPYRNYFAAGQGDLPAWEALEARGYAKLLSKPRPPFPYHCFAVTREGVVALLLYKGVKLPARRIDLIVDGGR